LQHQLGHKSASISLDRYGHLFPEELDHLADRLDRLHADAAMYPYRSRMFFLGRISLTCG
jgi:hypothetical protein